MFLRESSVKRDGKEYKYWRLIKTYWDKTERKVRHKTVAQLGKLGPEELKFFKLALSGKAGKRFSWEELVVKKSLEYLGVAILDRIWKLWELDTVIEEKAVEVLAINRCLNPVSDYQVDNWYEQTILPKLLGININPTKVYRTLDEISLLNFKIQQHLYKKITELKLDDYELIFYDITSSYFEQSGCNIARFGYSRDHRKDKKQIVLAMAVTKKGFPFYWKVMQGNTTDNKTVKEFIDEIRINFNVNKACLVMDKGMVNTKNIEKIGVENLDYVVTLTKDFVKRIQDMPWDYIKSIDEQNVNTKKDYFTYYSKRAYYKELKADNGMRYILCFNPEKFLQERNDRKDKIESIKKHLDNRNNNLFNSKRKHYRGLLREEVNKYLEKRGANKLFVFRITRKDNKLHISYKENEAAIKEYSKFDGIYVIATNLKEVSPVYLIDAYRNRMEIERSFHNLKSFIDIRPICHHCEDRIKAHVTVCVLGYLLNNTVTQMVRKKKDFEELTAQSVYNYLNTCKLVELSAGNTKKFKLTTPTDDQVKLTKILADESILDEDMLQKLPK